MIEGMHHILDVMVPNNEGRCKLLSQKAHENLNTFRKLGLGVHKSCLKNKKQTVKSCMFSCLLNDKLLFGLLHLWHNL